MTMHVHIFNRNWCVAYLGVASYTHTILLINVLWLEIGIRIWHQLHGHILNHWGRVTHICVGKPTIIGSDNGLPPDRRQAIIWTNAGILLIGPFGIYFSEILTGIQTCSFKKMHLKMSSAKLRPFCLGVNVHWIVKKHQSVFIFSNIYRNWDMRGS